jgi:hypothetical protein
MKFDEWWNKLLEKNQSLAESQRIVVRVDELKRMLSQAFKDGKAAGKKNGN